MPTRVARADGYGRSTRFYEVDGVNLPSVTSILSVIAKPALINWAAKTERELVSRVSAELLEDLPKGMGRPERIQWLSLLEQRLGKAKAHEKELTKASDIGSQAHKKIEWTLLRELKIDSGPEPALSDPAQWAFMAWEDWRKQANLVPILVEQTIYSLKHAYAGTLDLYCEIDIPTGGRGKVVVDWKTGKAIYDEALLQNVGYIEALIEMGHAERPTHGMIVRLPKVETDPAFEVKFIDAKEQAGLLKGFLAALALWRWQETRR